MSLPRAKIVLVCANNTSNNNLYQAVSTASHYSGVSVVSMSWAPLAPNPI